MVVEALFIGLVVAFVFYEVTGVPPGGVIAPGYCALFVRQPDRIAMTILLALLVWGILEMLAGHLILYGRRKLLLALLLGFCCKLAVDHWIAPLGAGVIDLQSIGYIIPGLIANEMSRQKLIPTLAGLIFVTVVVALILMVMR